MEGSGAGRWCGQALGAGLQGPRPSLAAPALVGHTHLHRAAGSPGLCQASVPTGGCPLGTCRGLNSRWPLLPPAHPGLCCRLRHRCFAGTLAPSGRRIPPASVPAWHLLPAIGSWRGLCSLRSDGVQLFVRGCTCSQRSRTRGVGGDTLQGQPPGSLMEQCVEYGCSGGVGLPTSADSS